MRRGGFEDDFAAESALRRFLEGRKLGFDADPHETLKPTTYARYRTYVLCELIRRSWPLRPPGPTSNRDSRLIADTR
ncbi:hypothetical protein ACFU6K_07740 [Kitasatospora sp. NPDC057512]|uniref:hypothetical protein n=1 Tax=Kitasatospora sp. NPDC057512 TaxID=3346154 RepID=UPI0036B24339